LYAEVGVYHSKYHTPKQKSVKIGNGNSEMIVWDFEKRNVIIAHIAKNHIIYKTVIKQHLKVC